MKSNCFARLLPLILLLLISSSLNAQYIPNMSFEGTPGESVSPQGWSPCNLYSTPDTQPGAWMVGKAPSDGNTYLSMVTRGDLGPNGNHTEAAQARLLKPLQTGKGYEFSLDLSFSTDFGHFIGWGDEFLRYDKPVKLRIFGGSGPCEKAELLWESPTINQIEWKTYNMVLKPELRDVFYIILEATYVGNTKYFGNICLDNFRECFIDLELGTEIRICENEAHQLDLTISYGQYIWSDGYRSPKRVVSNSGFYSVEVSNRCTSAKYEFNVVARNCNCDTAIPINVKSFDTLLCTNGSLVLNVHTPGGTYLWEDGTVKPKREVQAGSTYSVEISNGCETEFLDFFVGTKDCNCELKAPNVFTPNGDEFNQTFQIKGSPNIGKYNIKIFNRWGGLVYQSDKLDEGWDGTLNGAKVAPGVYFWTADVYCIQGNSVVDKVYKGYVTIIR